MARYFLDSSAFVKHYHQESGSSAVENLFRDTDNRLFISRLALVEFQSAIARHVREGVLTVEDFSAVTARMNADVAAGL